MPAAAPGVRLRLSALEIRLILPALVRIVGANQLWVEQGRSARAAEDPYIYEHVLRTDLYTVVGMRPFIELTSLDQLRSTGGRVRLSVFELAAAALAVRQTLRAVQHGHLTAFRKNHQLFAKQLLGKLECYRRRARRLFEKRLGCAAFRAAGKVWRDTITWVRSEFTWCRCKQPSPVWSRMLCSRRTVVDSCVPLAADGLMRCHAYPPPPGELRRMVRSALRSARRRKTGFGIRTILTDPIAGGDFLAAYILKNHGQKLERFDLATNLSALSERIANLQAE
jgi:hypothetical protein